MKGSKLSVRDILKKVARTCMAIIAIAIVLCIAFIVSEILFNILAILLYIIVAAGVIVVFLKFMAKVFLYIEQWKK